MARIKGVDIPNDKRIEISLTYIYGIGRKLSKKILKDAKVDLNKKAKDLTDDELSRIRKEVDKYLTEGDLRREINLNIKEPNDITFNNKKIGGILTQTKLINEKIKYLVVGIGINTNKEKFTDDIKYLATSIKKEFGIDVDTKRFIAEFCNQFEKEIEKRGVI
mgnify:CR=1 FL=1